MTTAQSETCWHKSTFSGSSGDGNCVEVALSPDAALVRDSKNAGGELLGFPTCAWRRFLLGAGRFGSA
jgi:hypothetical protein